MIDAEFDIDASDNAIVGWNVDMSKTKDLQRFASHPGHAAIRPIRCSDRWA